MKQRLKQTMNFIIKLTFLKSQFLKFFIENIMHNNLLYALYNYLRKFLFNKSRLKIIRDMFKKIFSI